MRTIKFLAVIATTFIIGCESNNEKNETTLLNNKIEKTKSFQNKELSNYKGQLPYLSLKNEADESSEIAAKLDLEEKINNPEYDWKYFNNLHSEKLSITEKQNLAFIILSTKDLIGLAQNNPENSEFKNAIKQNVATLTETEYIGYCVLYNAIEATNDNDFKKAQFSKIIDYAKADNFHEFNLKNKELENTPFYAKIKENYHYLEIIKNSLKK